MPPHLKGTNHITHARCLPTPQVARLARLAAGRAEPDAAPNGNGAAAELPFLAFDDFRTASVAAYGSVDVPDAVVDILVELRNWLQVGWFFCLWRNQQFRMMENT